MTAPTHRHHRIGLWFAGVFAVLTVVVTAGWTEGIDDAWYSAMVDLEFGGLVSIARGFHSLGTPAGNITLVVVGVALFVLIKRSRAAMVWGGMILAGLALSTLTKELVDRTRPLDGLVTESSASYPSGHVMVSATATGLGLALVLGMLWPHRARLFVGLAAGYIVIMAWSRTYLRAHWLTDVVGGALFGAAVVLIIAGFARAYVEREAPPADESVAGAT
jgi:undecaprenyl-diphosphatase